MAAQSNDPGSAPARVLIVEDEALIAMMLEDLVVAFGYAVVGATPSGERAIELALKERPDVVLMDVALGDGVSGIQAAHAISSEVGSAIVFMTAYGDAEIVRRMKQVAGAAIMKKPITEDALRCKLTESLAVKPSSSQAR